MDDPKQPYLLGFINLARTFEGRSFLWELFESSGLFSDPFVPGDPSVTAYRAGQQSVTRPLLDILMAQQPSLFATMIEENSKDE